eukprot:g1086.t1
MRILRAKHVRKTLRYFRMVLGIVSPYKIIMDGTFIAALVRQKLVPADALRKLLQDAPCEFVVPASVVRELEALGDAVAAAARYARTLQQGGSADGGGEGAKSASADIIEMAGGANAQHYFVATQDKELRAALRVDGRTPLLYANHAVCVLEPPGYGTKQAASTMEDEKGILTASELAARREADAEQRRAEPVRQKRRGQHVAKGPNPLSCKKRKNKGGADAKPKRKRRRRSKAGGDDAGGAAASAGAGDNA